MHFDQLKKEELERATKLRQLFAENEKTAGLCQWRLLGDILDDYIPCACDCGYKVRIVFEYQPTGEIFPAFSLEHAITAAVKQGVVL